MSAEKTDVYDHLITGLIKLREENDPAGPEGVTGLIVSRDEDGQPNDPLRFLADRASALLPKKVGVTPGKFRGLCRTFFFVPVGVVLLLGLSICPLSKANVILDSELVNLAGSYFWFLAVQLFFLTIALFFLPITLLGLLWQTLFPKKRSEGLSRPAQKLALLSGMVGGALVWGCRQIRNAVDWFCHWKKTAPSVESQAVEYQPVEMGALGEYFDRILARQNSLFFFYGVLSHLFWFSLSVVMVLILSFRIHGELYDYCWKSSLEGRGQVEKYVALIGRPLRAVVSIPTGPDIDWLFENSSGNGSSAKGGTVRKVTSPAAASEIREKWSWFLLTVVLFYAVLPRMLLTVIYFGLLRFSLRDFRPDLEDPYYAEILRREKHRGDRVVSETVIDAYPADEPFDPGPKTLPLSADEAASEDAAPAPPADITISLGFDVDMPEKQWRSILGEGENIRIFGNVTRSRAAEKEFLAALAALAERVGCVVVLIDVGFPPARQTRLFLQNEVFAPLARADVFVLLSCGERLRKKFESRSAAIAERLDDWRDILRQMAEFLERTILPVDFYDHELDSGESRQRLTRLIVADRKSASSGGTESSGAEDGRGKNHGEMRDEKLREEKFGAAQKIIIEAVAPFFLPAAVPSDDSPGDSSVPTSVSTLPPNFDALSDEEFDLRVGDATLAGYQKLVALYREENRSLLDTLSGAVSDAASRLFSRGAGGSTSGGTALGGTASGEGAGGSVSEGGESLPPELLDRLHLRALTPKELKTLIPTLKLVERTRQFCGRLSPKTAIAFGALGASLPLAAAAAPLAAGGVTLGAALTALGGLGTLLPATLVSGLTASALGSMTPMALSRLKGNILAKLPFGNRAETTQNDVQNDAQNDDANRAARLRYAEASEMIVRALAAWWAVFTLQSFPPDEIANLLPAALTPLDEADCATRESTTEVLHQIEKRLRETAEKND